VEFIRDILYQIQEAIAGLDGGVMAIATMIIRYALPALALIVVVRCARSLLSEKSEEEIWGQLRLPNGYYIDLNYWENVIGRAKTSDVYMEYPTISRNHAALIRDEKSNWRVYNIDSKSGIVLNGKKIESVSAPLLRFLPFGFLKNIKRSDPGVPVVSCDIIELGGVKLIFTAADNTDEYEQAVSRTKPGQFYKQYIALLYLTMFQILLGLQLCIAAGEALTMTLPVSFLVLIALTWICYFFTRIIKRIAFEIETIGFFLSTLGLSVIATGSPDEISRQILFIVLGLVFFFIMGWFLRDLDRVKLIRRPIALIAPVFLAVTLLFGVRINGAIRWINIAGMQFQPSEFVKIAIVFAGAATLERLFARRNIFLFLGLMGVCLGFLAMMNDFGSAMIFFVAYLVIAYLRSGDFATIILSVAGAGFAGLVALASRPHIAGRFYSWGRAWEFVNERGGYQQTRAMTAAASGGLFGVGAGNGWFHRIIAADSDLVFAVISEELGLLVALIAVAAVVVFAVFSVRSAGVARSSFYVIAACATSAILVFQMLLNVLGSMDIFPFTGVTFPFVSKGGTSLVACWGMLAFFKAVDTRQNASFAVKTPKRPKYSGGGSIVYKDAQEDNGEGGEAGSAL
jgi:cell division protein FtsW (lipid II flippase)